MEVMRVLQSYLDGQTDELTARRVVRHLDGCRRCGLEASTYLEIKAAVARQAAPLDEAPLQRLRDFASSLAQQAGTGTVEGGPNQGPPSA
jgi:anti-sigma factor RsiW